MVLNRCALSFITSATWRAVECYDLWRRYGRFPTDAPLAEQPDELMNIFRLMDNEYHAVAGSDKPLTQMELVQVLNAAFSDKKTKRKRTR